MNFGTLGRAMYSFCVRRNQIHLNGDPRGCLSFLFFACGLNRSFNKGSDLYLSEENEFFSCCWKGNRLKRLVENEGNIH